MKDSILLQQNNQQVSFIRPLILLCLIGGMILILRYFQLEQYLEKESMRQFIASYGIWAPIVYLAIWVLAPSLSIPATPILVIGGVMFGPVWGEIYVIFGATAGGMLAFLVARYLARDWLAAKLGGTRMATLDAKVAHQGWKIVALSRLIPIFPYFLVNYAFGLTKISLLSFALGTFFGMLPVTMAYVYFSANLLDLIHGNLSWQIMFGGLLVVLVALIPIAYKKFMYRPREDMEF